MPATAVFARYRGRRRWRRVVPENFWRSGRSFIRASSTSWREVPLSW